LAAADRRKDEFLAVLSHELRNPLASLQNAVRAVQLRGTERREAVAWAHDLMERQVRHLARLVDDLLDVSRISQGKLTLRTGPVDLAAVVRQAVENAAPLVEARRQRLDVSLPAEPLPLEADPTRLAQVVANLLHNAAKYTPEGGHVRLDARREGDQVVLRVADDGIGLSPEVLPRVFDLFAQAEPGLPHSQGGLGIGLTLVQGLVEMHGGSVAAGSEGPGKGSEFTIRLPALPDAPGPSPAGPASAGRPDPSPSRRVLVVDDNVDAAESLAVVLRLTGHEARTAHSGAEALHAAGAFRPEAVLLDLGLPGGLSGYELAPRLRQLPGLGGALLVALTGLGQEEDRRRSQEAGFDAHLTKPADLDALQALLARGGCPDRRGPHWDTKPYPLHLAGRASPPE
jgi:two-component system CheB/CheR fusion protein